MPVCGRPEVGNPEDRFSRVAAQLIEQMTHGIDIIHFLLLKKFIL